MNQMEDDYPLLGDLRESYLAAGGEQEDWDDLVHGLHHSQAALEWTDTSMVDHSKRLEELGVKSLAAGNLIEYEVRETDHGAPTGVAIGLIRSYRNSKSQVSLEIKHVTSTDSQFNDWAAYHINESGEFHLHLCKKPPGSCVAMPASKKVGWLHVARFRLTTYVGALSPVFDTDAILDTLRERVEVLIEAFSPEEPSRVELRPRGDGEDGAGAGVGGKRKADQRARDAAKKALSAAMPKFGEVKKKKVPEPEAPDRRRKKDEVEKAGGKPAESVKAQQAAHQAARALMGGHPQMVLAETKGRPDGKQNYGGRQPWLEGLSGMRIQISLMTETVNPVVELVGLVRLGEAMMMMMRMMTRMIALDELRKEKGALRSLQNGRRRRIRERLLRSTRHQGVLTFFPLVRREKDVVEVLVGDQAPLLITAEKADATRRGRRLPRRRRIRIEEEEGEGGLVSPPPDPGLGRTARVSFMEKTHHVMSHWLRRLARSQGCFLRVDWLRWPSTSLSVLVGRRRKPAEAGEISEWGPI